MKHSDITVQMVVRNEERFVWYALSSVSKHIQQFIITDTGSSDRTVPLIHEFIASHPESSVQFNQELVAQPRDVNRVRQKQLKKTKTGWFLLLDGDEIWPEKQLKMLLKASFNADKTILAFVNPTRNCVGDIFHYLPQGYGKYTFLGKTGHFNIRLMRNLPYEVKKEYPNEAYFLGDLPVNSLTERLAFSPAWYLHATHLKRTSKPGAVFGRRNRVFSKGITMKNSELPEVFHQTKPKMVPKVYQKRSLFFELSASLADAARKVKR